MAEKIDFKTSLDSYKAKSGTFRIVELPAMKYLMIDGTGDPNTSSSYSDAISTLYLVAYKMKFASKSAGKDYVVPPLEGLWWAEDMSVFTERRDKTLWSWTMMLMVPDWLDETDFDSALSAAQASKVLPSVAELRFGVLDEGQSVQTLHIGSYDSEASVLEKIHHDFIPAHGLRMTGKHHEIYLSDPRKTAPEKLRTILRQPVESI